MILNFKCTNFFTLCQKKRCVSLLIIHWHSMLYRRIMTAAKENAYYPYIKGNIIYFLHKPIYFTILHFINRLYTDTYFYLSKYPFMLQVKRTKIQNKVMWSFQELLRQQIKYKSTHTQKWWTQVNLNFTNNMYMKNRRRILLRPITSIAFPSLMLKTMGVYSRVKSAKHFKNYGDGLVNWSICWHSI